MYRKVEDLSLEDRIKLNRKILNDLVSRSSTLCYFFGFAFTIYSFTSFDIIRPFKPDLTLWDNFWPRVIFNGLPFLLLARWLGRHKQNTKVKAYTAMISIPLIFVAACFIHAWPVMWKGGGALYTYVHGANIYIITMTLIIISPPTRFLIIQIATFLLAFMLPLALILAQWKENLTLVKTFVGDFAIIFLVTGFTANQFFKLRLRVALSDIETRKSASLFLGSHLADAIYDEKKDLLKGYTQAGSILALDIRGYTNFVHNSTPEVAKAFMRGYHELVSKTIGQWGGYIHKSSGDGHVISFGVMEKEEDLSDVPGIEKEQVSANERKMNHILVHSTTAFEEIVRGFDLLKKQHKVTVQMLVGAGLSFGEIEVLVRGDEKYHKELDVDGESIVRAVRLESYSKFLNKTISDDSSFLVISPEFEKAIEPKHGIRICYTQTKETAVRDYPWIKFVYFRQWKHNRPRSSVQAA
ncbi:MAG: hypothetical protein A4S09_12930 [Proteobacteria bacterium SG_bin7]|nr:MAG: hypothetical protein A4S09_12930 [Proteobacteria bacterium SG_bin7]